MLHSLDPPLAGGRILIVEDEYLIADDLAASLRGCGADVVGPTATIEGARRLIDANSQLDVAVLDINLRDQYVYPLVDRLRDAGVPVVFTTGYDAAVIPAKYAGIPLCEKPVAIDQLVAELQRLIRGGAPNAAVID
jgi:DNA-binding response OmpR family regulator